MSQQRRKKAVEYHFVDMNDPDRYKKIKVARACDFCRRRKSKCDIGIPGSGTCSNCKKSNNTCIFSPVSSNATSPRKERPSLVLSQDSSSSNSDRSSSSSLRNIKKTVPPTNTAYQLETSFFSMDQRGRCSYEKQDNSIYNPMAMASSSPMHELPTYTKQMEQELFDVYFCYVHPFYPILDRYSMVQAMKYDSESIPTSLKLAVMAVSLHFSPQQQDAELTAAAYYQHASMQLDHIPSLLSLQILFLLYKYQELVTPVGSPLSNTAVNYLKEMQAMITQLQQPDVEHNRVVWSTQDEFVCRASWVVFIIITFSSTADDRWRNMMDCCGHRSRLPSLTETEQYDTGELNTFCNFKHLITIALLYSQSLSLISDDSSLFVNADHLEFVQLAQDLGAWKSSVPSRIALALDADPPILYSAQNHNIANIDHDSSKSGSYTSYICLVHGILDLIISIHRSSISEGLDIFKKASQVCYRAHSFTVGDMQPPHYSRLAAIQGSRIVSFGLTLALQAQSYVHEKASDKSLKNAKQYYSSCSLSFQIFDGMLLSPQLYVAIQTLRAQLDAKEQLNLTTGQQPYEHSSLSSSAQSTPSIQQQRSVDYGFNRPSTAMAPQDLSNSFYYSNTHEQHQSAPSNYHTQEQQQQWQNYSSNRWSMSGSHSNQEQSSSYYPDDWRSHRSMPITPTFEKDFATTTSTSTPSPTTTTYATTSATIH
ncbi:unnamed protein product [Mucor fragilis]